MTISKRIRFEVLKRDNYTCRYCGAKAPNAVLHVDHVMPVALGGSDKPENLVTACRDCNAGKAATKPGDEIIDEVNEKALAVAQAFRTALAVDANHALQDRQWLENIRDYWEDRMPTSARMPADANATLTYWKKIGVGTATVLEAIDIAASKENIPYSSRYKYMCGIVWNVIRRASDEAMSGDDEPQKCGHCYHCRHPEDLGEDESTCIVYDPIEDMTVCETCGDPHCLYHAGYQDGIDSGMQYEWQANYEAIMHYRTCPEVHRDGQ